MIILDVCYTPASFATEEDLARKSTIFAARDRTVRSRYLIEMSADRYFRRIGLIEISGKLIKSFVLAKMILITATGHLKSHSSLISSLD